jgi:hypothetical protein
MKLFRVTLFPLLLAFALLFAQQAGAAHTLRHALEDLAQQQKNKQAPHSSTCEKCADYAQLSSALNVGAYDFTPLRISDEAVLRYALPFRSSPIIAAVARGPPQLQKIA